MIELQRPVMPWY